MRTFSFYFHSGALAAYMTTPSASQNGINDLRASGYATAGDVLAARARGGGRRPRGGDDPAPFGNHPAFYCNPTRLRNLSRRVMATDKIDVLTPRNCKFYRIFFSLFKGLGLKKITIRYLGRT